MKRNRLVVWSCFTAFTLLVLVIVQQFVTFDNPRMRSASISKHDTPTVTTPTHDFSILIPTNNKNNRESFQRRWWQRRRLSSSFGIKESANNNDNPNSVTNKNDDVYYEQDRLEAKIKENFIDDDAIDRNYEYKEPKKPEEEKAENVRTTDDAKIEKKKKKKKKTTKENYSIPPNLDKNFTQFSSRKPYTQKEKLTVVITTYKQQFCLERMIMLLRSCTGVVAEIRVNWFLEDEDPSFRNDYTTNHDIPVIFDRYPDKLSYRFHPRNFTTDAVFSVDVDMFYSCESLDKALYTWHQTENAAVGFHGRRILKDGKYNFIASFLPPTFIYNTVFITKGGITHKNMFDTYFRDEYKYLRDMVDAHVTAEDILMSFVLDLTKTQIIMTCPDVHSTCMVNCSQGDTVSLVQRSSNHRVNLTVAMFDYFLKERQISAFDIVFKGPENVVWQFGKPQNECMSHKRNEHQNTPFCENFCKHNLICPSHVN